MRIFGGWLPFIGFRTFPVDGTGELVFDGGEATRYSSCFCLEWLESGFIISVGVIEDYHG
jgi:hypothetical protein